MAGLKTYTFTNDEGRDDQKARALGILADTRRKLYAILAEEEPAAPDSGEPAATTDAGEGQA